MMPPSVPLAVDTPSSFFENQVHQVFNTRHAQNDSLEMPLDVSEELQELQELLNVPVVQSTGDFQPIRIENKEN